MSGEEGSGFQTTALRSLKSVFLRERCASRLTLRHMECSGQLPEKVSLIVPSSPDALKMSRGWQERSLSPESNVAGGLCIAGLMIPTLIQTLQTSSGDVRRWKS